MTAVISSTYDDKYFFFLPIVTWCWNKLGVEVICFMPEPKITSTFLFTDSDVVIDSTSTAAVLAFCTCVNNNLKVRFPRFKAPEYKEATYAQCSRLYASALPDLPDDEILITSDIDMALFQIPPHEGFMTIFGCDLVPDKQVPICYLCGTTADWREVFEIYGRTYQKCLDDLLGSIEAEHFRGNFWSKDQEEAQTRINDQNSNHSKHPKTFWYIPRSNGQNQFATKRYDRDDAFLLDRLNPDTVDYHMPRPGYEEKNFNQIMTVLQYHYPSDNFDWLTEYRTKYMELL